MFQLTSRVAIATIALILAIGTIAGPTANAAGPTAISLGSAASYALLGGPAVTCTDSIIIGDVGAGFPGAPVTRSNCTITGTVNAGNAAAGSAYADFLRAYAAYATLSCPKDPAHNLTGTLAGVTLSPGTYCVDATAKTGTLTLDGGGNANAQWIFLVRAAGAGALSGTNFSVVMANGAVSCNVIWWVEAAATMTTSNFIGTILAGAAITLTGGTFYGDALATDAVTATGATVTACAAGSTSGGPHGKAKCNQGVGNGPEGCDPGNSNQGDPTRSNDERGGTPGNPGRQGGNK